MELNCFMKKEGGKMLNSRIEITEIMSELTPENQRTLLLCAKMACAVEGTERYIPDDGFRMAVGGGTVYAMRM